MWRCILRWGANFPLRFSYQRTRNEGNLELKYDFERVQIRVRFRSEKSRTQPVLEHADQFPYSISRLKQKNVEIEIGNDEKADLEVFGRNIKP